MSQIITKEILVEHFAGRSTVLQRTMIADWLQQPAHQQQYIAWLDEWERHHPQYLANDDAALSRLLDRIDVWEQRQPDQTETRVVVLRPFSGYTPWLVAATIALCLLAGLYAGKQYVLYQTIETGFGETRRLTLPDGSRVTLNAHSTLRLPRFGFGEKTRAVFLTGEAAFAIRHTPTHERFVVHTNRGVDVVVLGTEFNVYNRPTGTKVVLSKGAIQLNYAQASKAIRRFRLQPGDLVNVDPSGQLTKSHTEQPNISTAWCDNRFIFNSTTVREIADLLRDTYDLQVVLKSQHLAKRTVTGSFEAKNADEFLQVVAGLLEINYRQHGNTVTFFD
ncbi:FecR family protein [Spirosoma utsteinense]|uniref:Ferric-dicitrate binding protein FerR (Iron transport regulator) n=1 Tax=Spirosoma utsteinense TaxID=2585773 RepID=A0ABR6WAG2_9BACT|nr:FecR domain-containing protein [Spirosoma utsteinense]MBC3783876.1 ferric-dicitrate binding protein FerR (iron transport regulator) [Spirosoma utsteinense]MBC3793545.1 ferric-dicitrate binding protein FerR (iron transport regulator) [Spirosoma utsteinense]